MRQYRSMLRLLALSLLLYHSLVAQLSHGEGYVHAANADADADANANTNATQEINPGTVGNIALNKEYKIDMSDNRTQKWLFVVSLEGRTGSTTLMSMLTMLPNVFMAGENGNILEDLMNIEKKLKIVSKKDRVGSWKHGNIDTLTRTLYRQLIRSSICVPNRENPWEYIGFKEISLHTRNSRVHCEAFSSELLYFQLQKKCGKTIELRMGARCAH